MTRRTERNLAIAVWATVAMVGAVVLMLVAGLHLGSRLEAGQRVLDGARPAFADDRVAGSRAGITMVSDIVDLSDPIVTAAGGAGSEVPKLVAFVSSKTGLAPAEVLAALTAKFPHTTALLQAIPLERVTAELPGLVSFLSTTLKLPPEQVLPALKTNFPHLAQSIQALPTVTGGWENVPGTQDVTRFDGGPVRSVPDVRSYFAADVIPVLETQKANFQRLDSGQPKVGAITQLLIAIGTIVLVYGIFMAAVFSRLRLRGAGASATWGVVVLVGLVVVTVAVPLFPRLDGGQDLLDAAAPAFTDQRVAGDRVGISMVSTIVDLADPIVTARGGASGEVPSLVAFVSSATGLSNDKVMATLKTNFPYTTALLQAIPLEEVTKELPELTSFLATTLRVTPGQLQAVLAANFPHLAQSITALPLVTGGWNSVPGTERLTRFSGAPVRTVPDVRDYFSADVIPVLEQERRDFQNLAGTSPQLIVFPRLLTIVGAAVIIYGVLLIVLWRRLGDQLPDTPPGDRRVSIRRRSSPA